MKYILIVSLLFLLSSCEKPMTNGTVYEEQSSCDIRCKNRDSYWTGFIKATLTHQVCICKSDMKGVCE